MATNIPPHNLGEVIDACQALIENPDLTSEELIEYIPGPDFPTGGIMLGRSGARKAYLEGRGSVIMRAKTRVEEIRKDRFAIVIDEICYQVNKSTMIEKIAELVRDGKIDGVSDIRDESDRKGMSVVIELKRGAIPKVLINNIYKHTQLQTTFGAIMLAIDNGQPRVMNLAELLRCFITHRFEVITRRTKFELNKAEERAHILEGFAIALENLDQVIALIRASADTATARAQLEERFGLSQRQAQAILEMRLRSLTAMERQKVMDELEELRAKIADLKDLHSRCQLGAIRNTGQQSVGRAEGVRCLVLDAVQRR